MATDEHGNRTENSAEDGGTAQGLSRRTVLQGMTAASLIGTGVGTAAAASGDSSDELAQTPQMGWNSWNHFGCDIDAEIVKETADAMVESGMRDAGYEYVNIDDCWMAPERTDDGRWQPNYDRFPNGIEGVADYAHDKDMKLGIYSSAGTYTCQGLPASLGHEETDAQSMADWGVDYLKYDNCGDHLGMDPQTRYSRMWDALESVDRDIFKSQCSWGIYDEWTWAPSVGSNSWRTTGDITDSWSRIMDILDQQVGLAKFAGPGHWNDPDMLEVGNAGLSTSESRAHFSMWCILAAPLLAGNDVRDMSEETRQILTNEEVIALNQDPAGIQGTKRKDDGSMEVWAKPLDDGDVGVALLNRGPAADSISIGIDEFDLPNASAYILRDLWEKEEVATADTISASVPGHDVALYRVRPGTPDEAPPATTIEVETDDLTVENGSSTQVTVSLTNDGRLAIEDVQLSLSGPDGWDVSAITDTFHDNTAPSKSVETTWDVTAPDDALPGTYEFTVETTFLWDDGSKSSTTDFQFAMRVPLDPLPSGWESFASTDAEFGAIDQLDELVIRADGDDVWNGVDEYGALYRPDDWAGQNSTAVVKIHSQDETSGWAKAGLMIRNDVTDAADAAGYGFVAVTPGHGYAFQYDSDGDGYVDTNTNVDDSSYPVWLKLDRSGSTVTGSYSTDGQNWTEIDSADLPGAADVEDVALFATSHSGGSLCDVRFSDFSVTNEDSVSLSTTDDGIVGPGDSEALSATFHNYRQQSAEDLSIDLQAPDGWTVESASDTTVSSVDAGGSFTATWDVTAPSDATEGNYEFDATASFTMDGTNMQVTGSTSVSVPPAAPTTDTYLSHHDWVSATTGWGSIGIDESVGGNTLTIGGQTYDYGLGVHAESEVVYYLAGNMSRFVADVGIDDEVTSGTAKAWFHVVGDGEVLAETDALTASDDPVHLDVDISGVDMRTLTVTPGETIDYDHSDWAIAEVIE
ncbi:MAG: NPCBM/NEW2 domain-containing protein [Halapricum sp.]